jgi:hypothetical protein
MNPSRHAPPGSPAVAPRSRNAGIDEPAMRLILRIRASRASGRKGADALAQADA